MDSYYTLCMTSLGPEISIRFALYRSVDGPCIPLPPSFATHSPNPHTLPSAPSPPPRSPLAMAAAGTGLYSEIGWKARDSRCRDQPWGRFSPSFPTCNHPFAPLPRAAINLEIQPWGCFSTSRRTKARWVSHGGRRPSASKRGPSLAQLGCGLSTRRSSRHGEGTTLANYGLARTTEPHLVAAGGGRGPGQPLPGVGAGPASPDQEQRKAEAAPSMWRRSSSLSCCSVLWSASPHTPHCPGRAHAWLQMRPPCSSSAMRATHARITQRRSMDSGHGQPLQNSMNQLHELER